MDTLKLLLLTLVLGIAIPSQAQIYLNECMAVNDMAIADEFGEYDDWIELYNAGNNPVDLAGHFLSDDPNNPMLWSFPTDVPELTTIAPGAFLLVWTDNDPDQGPLHSNFKLSSNGEVVQLYAADGITLLDELAFGEQNADVSFGRLPDGGATLQNFPIPSPISSNANAGTPTYDGFVSVQIKQNNDDAEELPGGTVKLTSSDLELGIDGTLAQVVGLRFQDIAIPKGAIINKAYIQFTSFQSTTGVSQLSIWGEATSNATAFEATANNISSRNKTNNMAAWESLDWPFTDIAGTEQQTVDLSAIVQEIIDQSTWQAGNAMAFLIEGTGTRTAYAHDFVASRAAQLVVEMSLLAPQNPVQGLVINELASNGTDFSDEFGEEEDWVELYNQSAAAIEVGGLYLTDDLDHPTKWQISQPSTIPPGGFLIIWADDDTEQGGLHSNFKLGGNGETLALVQVLNNSTNIIDSISFGAIPLQASYGRESDGSPNWVTFSAYTPNASNNGSTQWLAPPIFSLVGGNYPSSQSVTLSHPDPAVQLFYTTDGTEPQPWSTPYNNPITVDQTQAIRARAFKGASISPTATQAYLIDESTAMASLFITTDPDNFFDDEIGIYVEGTNGIIDFCNTTPKNWNQDWERPIHLSLFETDGSQAFGVNAGARIGGACSRNFDMKSLNIYLRRNTYGDENVDYPIFPGRGSFNNYRRFKIRNSGQDFVRMGFRDGLLQQILWDQVDLDLQAFRPVSVYLNGEFWGIHNIRENFNDEYFEDYYGVDGDDLDLIKSPSLDWSEVKKGTDAEYNALYDFIDQNDLSDPANYAIVEEQMDVNEFLNYWIAMIYTANYDWPANNITVWKERKNNRKWRWALLDADGSTANGLTDQAEAFYNTLEQVTDTESTVWPNHRNSTLFFRKLLTYPNFRDEFIQRSCSFIELIFEENRVADMTDEVKNLYESEIDRHLAKWEAGNALGGDYWSWNNWVNAFKNFFVERPDYYRGFMQDHFNLSDTYTLSINYDANTGGDVFVNTNSMTIPYQYEGLYFKNVPLQVSAVAQEGFEFSHWLETGETNPIIQFIANADAVLTPIFNLTGTSVNLGNDVAICEGESTLVNVEISNCEDCVFLWSDGSNESSRSLSPLVSTTYSITVTSSNGSSASDDLQITVNALPQINGSSMDISCFGAGDGMIDLNVNGAGTFAYQWSNGSNTANLDNLAPNTYQVTVTDANACQSDASFLIEEPSFLILSLSDLQEVSCFGGQDGSISIGLAQGTPPYQVNWSNGAGGTTIEQLSAGIYLASITDANNCLTIESFEIEAPSPIEASSTIQQVSCAQGNDGSASVEGSGGTPPYQYNWSNGVVGNSIEQVAAGNYTLSITDAQGCLLIENILINQATDIETSTTSQTVSCFNGNDGAATIFATGGTAPLTYIWSNGTIGPTIEQIAAGNYTVSITDALNCMHIEEVIIDQASPIVVDNTSIQAVSCFGGSDGNASIEVLGGTPPFQYLWSNGATEQNIEQVMAGSYSVSISDQNNCQQIATIEVGEAESLESELLVNPLSCSGIDDASIDLEPTGGTAPYSYQWSTGSTNQSIDNLSPGMYSVTITDANECQTQSSAVIDDVGALQTQSSEMPISCFGQNDGAIDVTVNGGVEPYQYLWSNNSTSPSLSDLSPGTYTLTVSDVNDCQSITQYEIIEPDVLSGSNTTTSLSCFDANDGSIDLTVLGGTPPFTYQWSNMATDEDLTDLASGTYSVTIIDSRFCSTELTNIEIESPLALMLNAEVEQPSNGNDGSITTEGSGGTPPYSYTWSNNGNGPSQQNLDEGIYTVTLTDANDCVDEESFVLELSTSTIAAQSIDHLLIYPNPNQGLFNLELELTETMDIDIRIYDLLGQSLLQQQQSAQQLNLLFDLSHWPNGVYFVEINTVQGKAT
ncbi:MAG: CotH kinase family protein, partial [Bacteroidota bacterium]